MSDYGKWVGGVMRSSEGAHDPIARNTMAAQPVAQGKKAFERDDCDMIVLVAPGGRGDDFMEKFVESVGENPDAAGVVEL